MTDNRKSMVIIRKGIRFVRNHPLEPQLFPWTSCREDAQRIIEALARPVPKMIGSTLEKPKPGVDLSGKRVELAKFLAELRHAYQLALDDYEIRNSSHRPEKRDIVSLTSSKPPPEYDYGEDTNYDCGLDWEEFWQSTYQRGRGNPGRNRSDLAKDATAPPLPPVGLNMSAIVKWWTDATKKGFSPTFAASGAEDEEAEDFDRNNPPVRFLILVMKVLEPRYLDANARGIWHTFKKARRAAKPNKPPSE